MKKKVLFPELISVKDPTNLSEVAQKDLFSALCELANDFHHPDFLYEDYKEMIKYMKWDENDSDQDGDVYSIECSDCGKILSVKNLENEGVFVPWCINGRQMFIAEDVFKMFCVEDYMGETIGFVYCITADRNKFIKIGYSTNPHKRIKALQTSSPHRLEIKSFFVGEKSDEQDAQEKFRHLLTDAKNEWFTYDKEIVNYFRERAPSGVDCLM